MCKTLQVCSYALRRLSISLTRLLTAPTETVAPPLFFMTGAAITVMFNCPLLGGTAVFAQQQNLMPNATAAHPPVDQDDDNVPQAARKDDEGTGESPLNHRSPSGTAATVDGENQSGAAGSAGTSKKTLPAGAPTAPAKAAGGTTPDAQRYLHDIARSLDRIAASGGHSPARIVPPVLKAPATVTSAAGPAQTSAQSDGPPAPEKSTAGKTATVPQLSSLRTPVWRQTSSAEETVEPEHAGATDTTPQSGSTLPAAARGNAQDGGVNDSSAAGGGTSGEKPAVPGGTEPKAVVIEYTQVDLIPKLFKRSAMILDAQTANGHVSKEQLAKIVTATPVFVYKSKADKSKEAADKVAMVQGKRAPSDAKLDPRQPRKTGSSVLPTPATVTFDLDEVLRALKRENSLIDLKSIGETITTLRRAVTDHPAEPSLRIKLGSILLLAGDYDGAANEMRHAIALRPKDYRAHLLLAHILDDVGDHETGGAEFRRAIELAPNSPEPHSLYADSLVYQGEISAAINEYRRAIGVKPTADSLSGLADALIFAQDKIGSLKAARQAVSLDPTSAKAHVSLTKALILNGDQAASMRTARQAVLLSPALADSHIALGRALHAKGDLDDAVDEFKQAVTLDPLNAQARNDLGYALYSKGDILGAVSEFRIALRLNPRLGEARNNLEIAIHRLSGRKSP